MIKSMTGYGRATALLQGREITVELKSVNNRYLDCQVKLPRLYSYAEEAVKAAVQAVTTRGKVDVYITVNSVGGSEIKVSLNKPVFEGYLAVMREMVREYGIVDDISVSSMARINDVFLVEKEEEDAESVTADILTVVNEALKGFDEMRSREGLALQKDVESRAATIETLVGKVEEHSPETVAAYRARLEQKLREVLESRSYDESRIITEAAVFADKIAVDEETVRLRSHLAKLKTMLEGGSPIGRKLDFLMQELNREANTISSKCNDASVAMYAVDIKAELEKIREQIQNIE